MKSSYIFLAPGFEEIEAIAPIDVLRRAGMPVTTVAVNNEKRTKGAHGIIVEADTTLDEMHDTPIEWMILPGGMPGATNLAASPRLTDMLRAHYVAGGKIAAICASPAVVLAPLGILDGREATCYPGFEHLCTKAIMRDSPVIALPTLVTGNGPAAALRFALAIVKNTLGESKSRTVGQDMLYYPRDMHFYF